MMTVSTDPSVSRMHSFQAFLVNFTIPVPPTFLSKRILSCTSCPPVSAHCSISLVLLFIRQSVPPRYACFTFMYLLDYLFCLIV